VRFYRAIAARHSNILLFMNMLTRMAGRETSVPNVSAIDGP